MSDRRATPLKTLLDAPDDQRVVGPYRLVRQLGRGGFAPVWLAREVYGDTELRTAAIKLFDVEPGQGGSEAGSRSRRTRIVEEARALCRVEHPNVVRFHALHIDDTRGVVALAMEYLAGASLASAITSRGKLPPDEVLDIAVAIASALVGVHAAGLVHRDVKPDNVIDAGGVYKLIDFGIAAGDGPADAPPMTATALVMDDLPLMGVTNPPLTAGVSTGTVGYMDPARVADASLAPSAATDLYAFGATLFECLTGSLPAVAAARLAGSPGLSARVLDGRDPAPAVRTVEPSVPEGLARVVDGLLRPSVTERPPSAEVVAMELETTRRELAGRAHALPKEEIGPFRGLGRFEAVDRDVYFGRRVDVAAGLELLRARGLVALVGPSGAGKSSLARAGILPAIAEGALGSRPSQWDTVVTSPGNDARVSLVESLAAYASAEMVAGALEGSVSPEAFAAAVTSHVQSAGRGLVLLVDQLEELAQSAPSSREWAATAIVAFAERSRIGMRVIVTVRQDLLDGVLSIGRLGRAMGPGILLVRPLPDATWSEVLDNAMRAYGYTFENAALRAEILKELHGTAMPLAQFALASLWKKRDVTKKRLDWAAFHMIGGISGALDKHAERTFATVTGGKADKVEALRHVLLALTTPEGTRAMRKPAELIELGGTFVPEALATLEEARLIVREPRGVTLAHDALVPRWKRLWAWVVNAKSERLLAAEIESVAERWMVDQDPTLLFRKRRLGAARDLRRAGAVRLSSVAEQFLAASRKTDLAGTIVRAALVLATVAGVAGGTFLYVDALHREQSVTRQALAQATKERESADESRRVADNERFLAGVAREGCDQQLRTLTEQLRGASDAEIRKLRQVMQANAARPADSAGAKPGDAAKPPLPPKPTCPKGDPLCPP